MEVLSVTFPTALSMQDKSLSLAISPAITARRRSKEVKGKAAIRYRISFPYVQDMRNLN